MWNHDDKDLIGKSIKDIEPLYSGQAELIGAKKRNIILGASLGVLLVVFILVTVFGNKEPAVIADIPPVGETAGTTGESGDLTDGMTDSAPAGSEDQSGDVGEDAGEGELAATEGEGDFADDDAGQNNGVETISHLVRYGDDFGIISNLYYNTEAYAEALAAFNNMDQADPLYIGSYLRIPVDPSQM